MTRGRKAEPLARGTVFGCWTVLRESTPDQRGRQRYLCRASCCRSERVIRVDNARRAPARCVHCKGSPAAVQP